MNKEANISKDHYFDAKYLRRERMYSFVEQIEMVKSYAEKKDMILEIGKGNGFVAQFLLQYLGFQNLKTMDVNDKLEPDIVDDIVEPSYLKKKSYDIITCFEVLEHMPFDKSTIAVKNMCDIARKYLIISIPDMRYFISLRSTVFGTLPVSFAKILSTRRFRKPGKKFGDDHFWEIGLETEETIYSAEYVKNNLFENMNLVLDQRDIAVPWHHYYVIKLF